MSEQAWYTDDGSQLVEVEVLHGGVRLTTMETGPAPREKHSWVLAGEVAEAVLLGLLRTTRAELTALPMTHALLARRLAQLEAGAHLVRQALEGDDGYGEEPF